MGNLQDNPHQVDINLIRQRCNANDKGRRAQHKRPLRSLDAEEVRLRALVPKRQKHAEDVTDAAVRLVATLLPPSSLTLCATAGASSGS